MSKQGMASKSLKPNSSPGTVEVVRFKGHESAASMSLSFVSRVELFGVNGQHKVVSGSFGLNEVKARAMAEEYAELLGWKIRFFKEATQTVTVLEEENPVEAPPMEESNLNKKEPPNGK